MDKNQKEENNGRAAFNNIVVYLRKFLWSLWRNKSSIFLFSVLVLVGKHVFGREIHTNDYLNPFTLTFKNPKTVEMLNIIILYHYVMAFLVGIIVFTFIFIFLSFFRSYPFFYSKPRYLTMDGLDEEYIVDRFLKLKTEWDIFFYTKKQEYLQFYMRDIKKALKDQITHAPVLEFLWVVLPAIILVFIAYPSVMMLYYNEAFVNPVYNISAIGNQWYWTYEYNDFNLFELFKRIMSFNRPTFMRDLNDGVRNMIEFIMMNEDNFNGFKILADRDQLIFKDIPLRPTIDSNLIIAKDPKFLRLLSTDQCLVLPSKTPIRILVTSNDVIHSWAIPSYGVKLDAVPGRINQQLLNIPLTGTSWGQCSELCGVNHAYMPIEIKVLSFGDFLFYIELKVKELLHPYLLQYYRVRLNAFINFIDFLRANIHNRKFEETVLWRQDLEKVLNLKKILSHKK